MDVNDLKLYSVILGEGSGVLFQPMNELDYTYILTANHNLFKTTEDERGNKEKHQLSCVDIVMSEQIMPEKVKFEIKIGQNYFPHENADVAILKIDYIAGFQSIFINESFNSITDYHICGYPGYLRTKNNFSEKYTKFRIDSLISNNKLFSRAQLNDSSKEQSQINGLSGGGILKLENNYISLIGIQSEVSSHIHNGQIDFVPVKLFFDIINDSNNKGKLSLLYPPYIGSFSCLKEEILKLESCIDPVFIDTLRGKLKLKVDDVKLTPLDIRSSKFNNQLLMFNENNSALNSKKLWVSWLEYLVVLQIVKEKALNGEDIQTIFNNIRLIHSERTEDWLRFMSDIFKTDLYGLEEKGVLIVSSNKAPSKVLIEGEEMINNIANAFPVDSFQTDNADIHPLQQFKFMHISVFERICEDNESDLNKLRGIRISELFNELKRLYNELLQSRD